MRKFKIDPKFFTICVYVFMVIAVTTVGILIGVNFSAIWTYVSKFFSALKCVIYGLAFSYFINYILKFTEKRIMPWIKHGVLKRVISLICSYLFLLGILTAFILLIAPEISKNYQALINNVKTFATSIIEKVEALTGNTVANMIDISVLFDDFQKIVENLFRTGGQLLKELGNIVIGFVLSFYILLRKEHLKGLVSRLTRLVFPHKFYGPLVTFTKSLNRVFGQYFAGTIIASFFVGIETLVVCLISRIPYAYLVAVIVAFTNVIPYFGPFLGAIPSFIIIFTVSPIKALWFAVIILAIQQIDGNFITPRIIGTSVGISSIWVIISVTVFNAIFGIIGMVIGVPLFTIIYDLVKNLVNSRLEKKGYTTDSAMYENLFSMPAGNTYASLKFSKAAAKKNEEDKDDETVQA